MIHFVACELIYNSSSNTYSRAMENQSVFGDGGKCKHLTKRSAIYNMINRYNRQARNLQISIIKHSIKGCLVTVGSEYDDILGRVHNQPDEIYVLKNKDDEIYYIGLDEII